MHRCKSFFTYQYIVDYNAYASWAEVVRVLFNSLHFLVFFLLIFVFYFLIPYRYRWIFLLAASYYFYMSWRAELAILILLCTVVNYYAALLIQKYKDAEAAGNGVVSTKAEQRIVLVFALLFSFGMLFVFKYLAFFTRSINQLFSIIRLPASFRVFDLILPVGISFFTFQTLSYTIDVYKGDMPAEKHFGYVALFISFFPQLVAGPIERATSLLPQFREEHDFSYEDTVTGLRIMLIGYFKKVAVADTIAVYVNSVYNNPQSYTGLPLSIATLLFAFQIYCDFSGYSDIAIGTARILGFRLMTNFRSPYLAHSISAFWRRWHISLSTWFRDYVYIPLGGNRKGLVRQMINLSVTFIVSGLWHGANWTFLAWGTLHAVFSVIQALFTHFAKARGKAIKNGQKSRIKGFLSIFCTFVLVCFAWVFFRANSIGDAIYILRNIPAGMQFNWNYVRTSFSSMGFNPYTLGLTALVLVLLAVLDMLNVKRPVYEWLGERPLPVRWLLYVSLSVITAMCLLLTAETQSFIYFQF